MKLALLLPAALALPLLACASHGDGGDAGPQEQTAPAEKGAAAASPMDEMMARLEASLLAVGSEAPNVVVTTMNDESVRLDSFRGKTVLLNFWFYH